MFFPRLQRRRTGKVISELGSIHSRYFNPNSCFQAHYTVSFVYLVLYVLHVPRAEVAANLKGRLRPVVKPIWGSRSHMGSKIPTEAMMPESVHQFTVRDSSGSPTSLSNYKGKILLIVNVASRCGLTPSNYKELTDLHNKHRDLGFEVLAFPCNQFGAQEPGSSAEIEEFACTRFAAKFPILDKIDVNGRNADPLYTFLKSKSGSDDIKWNFTKFLINRDGIVVGRYAPKIPPLNIEKDIQALLNSEPRCQSML